MKRKLLWAAGILTAFLVLGYLGITLFLGSAVKAGVNRFAPSITQTPVRLEGALLSPFSGSGTLTGLLVGNPTGWSGDKAFYLGKVHLEIAPRSIFSDCIVINDVEIDHAEFVYETKVVSSNIGDLLKNMQGASSDPSHEAQPTTKKGTPLKLMVKHFALTNGRVTLGFGPTALTLPMPPVVLNDLGTQQGGISPTDLTLAVMRTVSGSIVSATTNAAGKIGSTMGAAAGHAAKSAGQTVKGLFGGKE